jgi:hypothetical protein
MMSNVKRQEQDEITAVKKQYVVKSCGVFKCGAVEAHLIPGRIKGDS